MSISINQTTTLCSPEDKSEFNCCEVIKSEMKRIFVTQMYIVYRKITINIKLGVQIK
jgi:hypothetical protein